MYALLCHEQTTIEPAIDQKHQMVFDFNAPPLRQNASGNV